MNAEDRPSLATALEQIAPRAKPLGPLAWELPSTNGAAARARVRQDGDWVLVTESLSNGVSKRDPWDLLIANGQLPGSTKLAYPQDEQGVELRVELPIADGGSVAARLRRALASFDEAKTSLRANGKEGAQRVKGLEGADHPQGKRLAHLCVEAGWPFHERAASKLVVDLETGSGFHQARLEPALHGSVCASVELADCTEYSEESRRSLGILLLSACGALRYARASVATNGEPKAFFEVWFETEPSVIELGHALSALSVACRQFGREARALADQDLASKFLAFRKRSWL